MITIEPEVITEVQPQKTTREEIIDDALAWFEEDPRRLRMETWLDETESCGTVGCLAGVIVLRNSNGILKADPMLAASCFVLAKMILGITTDQAYRLFYVSEGSTPVGFKAWPFDFATRFLNTDDHRERLNILRERCAYFLVTSE